MKVLIVDPSQEIRKSLLRLFSSLSLVIKTTEASNGKLALRALTESKYDLIITELDMDGGSGEVFINHLKSSKLLKHKPIIVYSDKEFDDTGCDNIVYANKHVTPMHELNIIIKELIFKNYICKNCIEAINGETCNDICFYKAIDTKWKDKLRELK